MVASTKIYDMTGNQQVQDGATIAWDSMLNAPIPVASQPTITAGSGAPTFSSTKGSLYLNITASAISTRVYVNNGTTAWIALTTAS